MNPQGMRRIRDASVSQRVRDQKVAEFVVDSGYRNWQNRKHREPGCKSGKSDAEDC